MTDFTIKTYKILLSVLINQGYAFQTFLDFLRSPANKVILLRHDVDACKENSLRFAEIQYEMGIHGSYFFRVVPQSFDKEVIRKVASLGHEIGYHYETMDTISKKIKDKSKKIKEIDCDLLIDIAYEEFCRNLEIFRKIVPVETICMHGSPLSPYDNKAIWKKYSYRDYGIIGEPYFDLDFSKILYLTDTGRRWDGDKVSVRDKVQSSKFKVQRESSKVQRFRTTFDIIDAANSSLLPDQIMFTFHPQRWTDKPVPWLTELVMQNVKNVVKRILVNSEQ